MIRPSGRHLVRRSGSQAVSRDFVELTEDVSSSPLWNRDLAPTSGNEVYEAWMIAGDAAPVAIGGFQVAADGTGYLETAGLPTEPGLVVALTREPREGMTAPSGDPVSVGTTTATATG